MENKCRACLSTESLFDWSAPVAQDISYADLFFHITNLIHDKTNQTWLCNDCGCKIDEIYKFIEIASAADQELGQEVLIKDDRSVEDTLIEIAPLKEEIIYKTQPKDLKHHQIKTDSEQTPDEFQTDDADFNSNCSPAHETEDELETLFQDYQSETTSQKSNEIKFEMVVLNSDYSDEEKVTKKEDFFSCEICGKEYKTAFSKKRHMAVHSTEKFECDVCPRSFHDKWSLKKHKRTHDKNRKRNFTCHRCGMKFLTSHSLKGHMEVHNDKRQKNFQCDQCEKAFFHRGALNVHMRMHTGNMLQCEVCEKRYPREIDLELHMRTHTGEQPVKCATCGKCFKYNSTLYNHVRKEHCGYFKCSYCSKQYKDIEALAEHKQNHKKYTYKCVLCDKEATKKYLLKCHVRSSHNVESPEEVEQLIISNKSESKHRTMRKFTDIEYEKFIKIASKTNSTTSTVKQEKSNRKTFKEESSDEYETE